MLVFGPVPSRRLGRSLGINNIPPKACSFSCVYCQVGPTETTEIVPRPFYPPEQIYQEVREHIEQVQKKGEQVDYLTFVPDGEPTLDSRLSESIEHLRSLEIPIAIISNTSLIWREEVRKTLAKMVEDLLSITSVHPMREEAVQELLIKSGSDWHLVAQLIADRRLVQTEYEGRKFYIHRIQQSTEKGYASD